MSYPVFHVDFWVEPTFGGYGPPLPKVIVHRNPSRLGLIQAKMIGTFYD